MADDALVQYILQNRERFTPEALRDQLKAAGHTPDAIEEAFRAADAVSAASHTMDLRPRTTVIMVAAYVAVWLVFQLFATLSGAAFILGIFLVAGALISLLAIWLPGALRRVPPDRVISAVAGGLIVPLAILLGLAGLCIATTDPFHRTYLF